MKYQLHFSTDQYVSNHIPSKSPKAIGKLAHRLESKAAVQTHLLIKRVLQHIRSLISLFFYITLTLDLAN